VLVSAVVLRVAAAVAIGNRFHFADEAIYLDAARRLLQGDGFGAAYAQTPGYPVFLAMLSAFLPDTVLAVRLAQSVLAGVGAGLVYLLGERLIGRVPALVAAAIYALDPLLVVTAGLLYPETLAAILLVGAVLAAWQAAGTSLRAAGVAGALLGALALVRPVGLVLVPVVPAWIALRMADRRAAHVGLVLAATLLVLAPWTYRNYRVHGQLAPIAVAGTHTAPVSPQEVAADGLTVSIVRRAWSDPGNIAGRTARQFLQFWELTPTRLTTDDPELRADMHRRDPRLPTTALVPSGPRDLVSMVASTLEFALALVGLVVLWRRRPDAALLITGVTFTFALGYALFVAKLRYRIPVLPLVFLLAGVGACHLAASALGYKAWGPGGERVVTGRRAPPSA